uniref:Hypotheticial protein n=1 Tax=Heterorhabditis bacteriophora TaxID=37862 RepID=A0A1I7WMY4_HETBA
MYRRELFIFFVLTYFTIGTYCSDAYNNEDDSIMPVKRYINFNLMRSYVSPQKSDSFEARPIILETRQSRNKLDCILNLRSFELCRSLL